MIFILRKRLLGVFCIYLVYLSFVANTPDDCIYVVEKKIDSSLFKEAIFDINSSAGLNEQMPLPKAADKKKDNAVDLEQRYKGLGYKNQNAYIKSVISDFMPTVKKYADIYDIPASVVMALFINEFVIPSEKRLGQLAQLHHNYGSLKEKSDVYLSEDFKKILDETVLKTTPYKDDERNKKGELINSSFYSFKSKEAGIRACVAFIADRAKSSHPNYVGKFDNLSKEDIYGWAYALYDAGYANKKANEYPLDKKIIRIIKTYNLQ